MVSAAWPILFSAIATAQSGASIVTSSSDSAGQVIVPHSNRLNCMAGMSQVADNPTPDRYFVAEGFSNTPAGQFWQLRAA